MKKLISWMVCVLLLVAMAVPAMAAEPVITVQPGSPVVPENGRASYTVYAVGENLRCIWYLEFEGKTYDLTNSDGSEPWSGYTRFYGEQNEGGRFTYYFEGIQAGLDGAKIWAVVEDGHYSVTSAVAYVQVTGSCEPPALQVPASMEVCQDDILDLYCSATAPAAGGSLSYEWYETSTGKLQDISAVFCSEDTYRCDTTTPGTRYYICMVTTAAGGRAYSGPIAVTVLPEQQEAQVPVLFTSGSQFRAGGSATVDIEAMTNYDARIWNAFLERNVVYVWYENGTAIPELINKDTAYFGTAGAVWQVMVKCDDLEILSEKMTIAPAVEVPDLVIRTKTLPDATVGEEYYTRIECSDLDAEIGEYYNPGKPNDLSKTGLTLTKQGALQGIPKAAGSYTFTVYASGAGGEDYATYTLKIQEAPATEAPTDAPTEAPTDPATEVPTEPATQAPGEADPTQAPTADPGQTSGDPTIPTIGAIDQPAPMPWWAIVLIALAAAAMGVLVAVLILKKKK